MKKEKQKVIFFGVESKSLRKILSLFGIYAVEVIPEPNSFFEFKNHFLEEKTQFIFLKNGLNEKFKKELDVYFKENYQSLFRVRTSVSFLKLNFKSGRWTLEAIKIPKLDL